MVVSDGEYLFERTESFTRYFIDDVGFLFGSQRNGVSIWTALCD